MASSAPSKKTSGIMQLPMSEMHPGKLFLRSHLDPCSLQLHSTSNRRSKHISNGLLEKSNGFTFILSVL